MEIVPLFTTLLCLLFGMVGCVSGSADQDIEPSPMLIRLTDNGAHDFHPSWSPDGTMILYDSQEGDSASTRILRLRDLHSEVVGAGDHPYWLPAGQHITTIQYLPDDIEVVSLLSLDGASTRRLTNADGRNGAGFPSPDGRLIAFLSNRDGDWELYVVPVEGGAEKNSPTMTQTSSFLVGHLMGRALPTRATGMITGMVL